MLCYRCHHCLKIKKYYYLAKAHLMFHRNCLIIVIYYLKLKNTDNVGWVCHHFLIHSVISLQFS